MALSLGAVPAALGGLFHFPTALFTEVRSFLSIDLICAGSARVKAESDITRQRESEQREDENREQRFE